MNLFSLLIACVASLAIVSAFTQPSVPKYSSTKLAATRQDFLKFSAAAVFGAAVLPTSATAAGFNPFAARDPIYEDCFAKCMFDCTKPTESGQKTRAACRPTCTAQCEATKDQLDSKDPSEVTQQL
jgi:hypothetical protein